MGKNSFVIYKSFYSPISHLTDEQLGRLFRSIFDIQINGEASPDEDILPYFKFFENQFKIDNAKYDEISKRRAESVKKRWNKVIQKNTNDTSDTNVYNCIKSIQMIQNDTNDTSITDNDILVSKDTMNISNNNKENTLTSIKERDAPSNDVATLSKVLSKTEIKIQKRIEREKDFYNELIPYVPIYGKEMVRAFYEYWTEPTKSKTLNRKDQQKTWSTALRLETWNKREIKHEAANRSNYSSRDAGQTERLAGYSALIATTLGKSDEDYEREQREIEKLF